MLYPLSYGRDAPRGASRGREGEGSSPRAVGHGKAGCGLAFVAGAVPAPGDAARPQAIELPPSTWRVCPTRWSEAALQR